jgi:signal transduction histidine kinase/CheY-like chemotaxis protein
LLVRDASAAIFYVMLCGITAGTAVYVCAAIRAYAFFLLGMWSVAIVALYWVFPDLWLLLASACLLFCGISWQHANSMHRFVVKHAELEEQSLQLARSSEQAHEAAIDALEEKNRFLSIASHDLRQPLYAMSLLVEAARARNQDAGMAPLLDDLRSNMSTMSHMFNSLMDLSRMEAGGITPNPEPVALSELMHDVERIFEPQAKASGLELRLRLPRREVWVQADATLLRQVLFNLVHNALRYTHHGGILIAARRAGSSNVRLEVWDSGVGIKEEDRAHLFTPYYRGQHTPRADTTGSGLGLAVVARCAKLMGHAPHGFRSRIGRGSVFWMRLPAAMPLTQNLLAISGRAASYAATLQGCCLIVDDDPPIRSASQLLLESWGLEIRGAADGSEAFALLRAGYSPRVILCDQRLHAGESGAHVLQALLDACPDATGAIISGEFDSPELRAAEEEGFIVLRKPVDPALLYSLLSTWLVVVESPVRAP